MERINENQAHIDRIMSDKSWLSLPFLVLTLVAFCLLSIKLSTPLVLHDR
jgi:hypothetical protein